MGVDEAGAVVEEEVEVVVAPVLVTVALRAKELGRKDEGINRERLVMTRRWREVEAQAKAGVVKLSYNVRMCSCATNAQLQSVLQ